MSVSDVLVWAGLLAGEVYLIYLFEHSQIAGKGLVITSVVLFFAGVLTSDWARKYIWRRALAVVQRRKPLSPSTHQNGQLEPKLTAVEHIHRFETLPYRAHEKRIASAVI